MKYSLPPCLHWVHQCWVSHSDPEPDPTNISKFREKQMTNSPVLSKAAWPSKIRSALIICAGGFQVKVVKGHLRDGVGSRNFACPCKQIKDPRNGMQKFSKKNLSMKKLWAIYISSSQNALNQPLCSLSLIQFFSSNFPTSHHISSFYLLSHNWV